jgi:hypothetical protein
LGPLPGGGPNFGSVYAAWSPDGKRLAVIPFSGAVGGVVWLVEPGGRETYRKLIDFPVGIRPYGLTWTPDGTSLVLGLNEERSDILLLEKYKNDGQ